MQSVWKYSVSLVDSFKLALPKDSEILSLQTQCGLPYVWALVTLGNEKETRKFRLAGTGNLIEENIKKFIGTFQLDGELVFHLFEIE
jgi:hypothetical protein